MINLIRLTLGVHQNIINKKNQKKIQELTKNLIHKIHKYCRSIIQVKKHHQKLKKDHAYLESNLRDIHFPNHQLMVTRLKIDLGEEFNTKKLVKQIINPWKRLLILYRHLIQLLVINIHLKGTILLTHQKNRYILWGHTRMDKTIV